MQTDYNLIKINVSQASELARDLYQIEGEITPLPGEIDFNFKITGRNHSYLLKISRPDFNPAQLDFQQQLLDYILKSGQNVCAPEYIPAVNGNFTNEIIDSAGHKRMVRMLSWIDGRVWSQVNPINDALLYSLGEKAGLLNQTLQNFSHPAAQRKLDWDIAQAEWINTHLDLFSDQQKEVVNYFFDKFLSLQATYKSLRKAVIHNDANDNNILVSEDLVNPRVIAIIDFGDSVYTQIINDLAVAISYAIMNKTDVLHAALPVVSGYNANYPLLEEELRVLYTLVAMRLVISVTKSAINKQKEPDNNYLLVSEKPAWDVLSKWKQIDEQLAYYSFRSACGMDAHPNEQLFASWAQKQTITLKQLFPKTNFKSVKPVDMSISSTWLGNEPEFNDISSLEEKMQRPKLTNPESLIAGGYLETRPFYTADTFKMEGNNGPVYRSTHLGIDFWLDAQTAVHAVLPGTVFSIFNNEGDKDYGPTLILKHQMDTGLIFYTLYGHLSIETMSLHQSGQAIEKGDIIGYIGAPPENGNWVPHLHFQIILDLLGNKHDFPGVIHKDAEHIWRSICPDPNLLFNELGLQNEALVDKYTIASYRNKHLGKSLSLSYQEPLHIVRGNGAFLIDDEGRKYLDTVNNVAHVGHEHPRVVRAGQEQMAVLNTNTRYLHKNITEFAEELLSTLPEKLQVVHFVNSGSEANELALRMVQTYTGQRDIIAIEVGYHGNTNGCIDVSSYKFDGKGGRGAPEHTHIVPLPDSYRGLYRGENTGPKYAAHIQEQINRIGQKGRKIAGFICESIMSCGGQIELPEDFLRIAYNTIRKAGGLCISDEVQVGCGRVGSKFWGFELYDVVPDIITVGKPIGNGHPLAAVVCTREVADSFANGMEYFNTFGGNPVSCAIGRAVLGVIKDEKLQENALHVGNYLKSGLKELQGEFPVIGDVRGQGLFLGFELVDHSQSPLADKAVYLVNRMKELAILMSTDGKDNNVIKIKPPLVFSIENANELLYRLKSVLNEDFMKHMS